MLSSSMMSLRDKGFLEERHLSPATLLYINITTVDLDT